MENDYKEVYFNQYCETCEYKNKSEDDSPCDECLKEPINVYSHKPVKYVDKK